MRKRLERQFVKGRVKLSPFYGHAAQRKKDRITAERSGATGYRTIVISESPRFSPFSPPGWSLQTPHTLFPKVDLPSTLPCEPERENLYHHIEAMSVRKPLFQLVFLGNDDDQSVEVKEVAEIDFADLKARLTEGESVFITKKEREKLHLTDLDAVSAQD